MFGGAQSHKATKAFLDNTHTPIKKLASDVLSKLASSSEDQKLKRIQQETLMERSLDPHVVLCLDRSST